MQASHRAQHPACLHAQTDPVSPLASTECHIICCAAVLAEQHTQRGSVAHTQSITACLCRVAAGLLRPGVLYRAALEGATYSLAAALDTAGKGRQGTPLTQLCILQDAKLAIIILRLVFSFMRPCTIALLLGSSHHLIGGGYVQPSCCTGHSR
jgi:hypothetical protein